MNKTVLSLIPVAALAAPLAIAAPLAANAQQAPQQPQQPPQQQQQQQQPPQMQTPQKSHVNVSDKTLHKFAAAYQDQMKLRTKYVQKLQNAKNDKDKKSVEESAQKDMKKAIQKHMSVKEYKKVGQAVNSDPKLRQRLVKILQSEQKESGPPGPQAA
jgi:hypothetical protein